MGLVNGKHTKNTFHYWITRFNRSLAGLTIIFWLTSCQAIDMDLRMGKMDLTIGVLVREASPSTTMLRTSGVRTTGYS